MFLFYYSRLNKEAQTVYNTIAEAFSRERRDIAVDLSRLKDGELARVITAIFNDHPEFYVENDYKWHCTYTLNKVIFSAPVRSVYNDKIEMDCLLEISRFLTRSSQSEYEIVKNVHDFVINSVKYDRFEADNDVVIQSNHNAIGAFCTGKSVCEGIARLTQLLLNLSGVQATYCNGYLLKDPHDTQKDDGGRMNWGHGWNVVCIDGNYYHLDVSHDVCRSTTKTQKSYCYFALPYREIIKDRTLNYDEDFRALPCKTDRYNYFRYNNRFFTSFSQLSESLYNNLRISAWNKRTSSFYQFRISDSLRDQCTVPWNKICMSEVYKVFERFSENNKRVRVTLDPPSYVPSQGVMSVNFTFTY